MQKNKSYDVARQLIKSAEGFRSKLYECTEGYPTIGYGHKLLQNEIGKLKVVTLEQAEQLLQQEMQEALAKSINEFKDCWNQLNEYRQAVIIDMHYNLGSLTGWGRLKAAIRKADYQEAAREIMDSHYATQVKNRAKRNACMMRDGIRYTRDSQNWEE